MMNQDTVHGSRLGGFTPLRRVVAMPESVLRRLLPSLAVMVIPLIAGAWTLLWQSPVISDRLSAEKAGPNTHRWLRLTVEDHGTGIPQDLRERMFNPFFSTKAHHKGTGLGLSISHGIVTDHGGTLSVESEVGHWTRFSVDLPVDNEWKAE